MTTGTREPAARNRRSTSEPSLDSRAWAGKTCSSCTRRCESGRRRSDALALDQARARLSVMRAIISREHGGPEVLRLDELPLPTPGRFQLLVRVHATSVNPVDAKVRRGGGAPRAFPLVLGFDASGVVRSFGPDVEGWSEGDTVFGCPNLFGPGANADYVLLDARAAARKPSTIDHATSACLPLVGLTAWEGLHDRAQIQPGQTVLVHAGAGGVGH